MSMFSAYCNEKLGTKGEKGIKTVDWQVTKVINKAINDENVLAVENVVEEVDELLEITDDAIEELAKARVVLVIARMFENMTPGIRSYVVSFFDEEIPCYREARQRFDELDQ